MPQGRPVDKPLIELTDYLLGETTTSSHPSTWNYDKRDCFPVLASPLADYLHEINRFLFSGGISVDVVAAQERDPRQVLINRTLDHNNLQANLESLWVRGAVTGEVLCVIRLDATGDYTFDWYEAHEFTPVYKSRKLSWLTIETTRYVQGKPLVFRLDVTPEAYIEYPLVPPNRARDFDWAANATTIPHGYREVPATIIKNSSRLSKLRGKPEFNHAACKMAATILMLTHDSVENMHFFGTPIFTSPDPKDTLKRLKARVQVLQKEANEDGGSVDLLTPNAITPQHLDLIERLEQNFKRHLGIKSGHQDNTHDVSSLSLRILNSATISKAESKWLSYVDNGLRVALQLVLKMAAVDGILSIVNPNTPETYQLAIHRLTPYFSETPQEQLQQLELAARLVDLGVDRSQALKETYWPQLSLDQISALLRPNFEDI